MEKAFEMLRSFHEEIGTHCEKHKEKGSSICHACKLVKEVKVRLGEVMRVIRETNPN